MTRRPIGLPALVCLFVVAPAYAQSDAPAGASPIAAPLLEADEPPERGIHLTDQNPRGQLRHSRFMAGPGGPLFVFSEVITGLVSGGIVGNALGGRDGTYLGAISGGVLLGGLAGVYAYFVPINMGGAMLSALGATTGLLAGLGLVDSFEWQNPGAAWAIAAMAQVGVIATLLSTLGGNVSTGDAGLVAMTSYYASVFTGLSLLAGHADLAPLWFAPLAGTAVGGLLASIFDVDGDRLLKLTLLPTGVGLILLYAGSFLSPSQTALAATAMIGIGVTLGLTVLFTSPNPDAQPARAAGLVRSLVPTAVVVPAERREGVVIGPGLAGIF